MSLFTTATTKGQLLAALNSLLAVNDVADNAAKLALTGIDPLYTVRVTGEANRIEQYIGSDPASDNAWIVLRNTVNLTVSNMDGPDTPTQDITVNGISCPANTSTEAGWVAEDKVEYTAPDILRASVGFNTSGVGNSFVNLPASRFAMPTPQVPREASAIISVFVQGA